MVKEIAVHKIAVALVVAGRKANVLVKVYAVGLGKIQSLVTTAADQLLINAQGAGTSGQAKTTIGLFSENVFNYIRRLGALGGVVFGNDDFQYRPSLKSVALSIHFLEPAVNSRGLFCRSRAFFAKKMSLCFPAHKAGQGKQRDKIRQRHDRVYSVCRGPYRSG